MNTEGKRNSKMSEKKSKHLTLFFRVPIEGSISRGLGCVRFGPGLQVGTRVVIVRHVGGYGGVVHHSNDGDYKKW